MCVPGRTLADRTAQTHRNLGPQRIKWAIASQSAATCCTRIVCHLRGTVSSGQQIVEYFSIVLGSDFGLHRSRSFAPPTRACVSSKGSAVFSFPFVSLYRFVETQTLSENIAKARRLLACLADCLRFLPMSRMAASLTATRSFPSNGKNALCTVTAPTRGIYVLSMHGLPDNRLSPVSGS